MHRSSYDRMAAFRDAYLGHLTDISLRILDVGSASIGGDSGYRPLFGAPQWHYIGLDLAPGPNVDLVTSDPYVWSAIPDGSFDIVISGQAFEHIEWPWLTIREVARVLRGNGLAAITAPSAGPVHRCPVDCWRYYPDGLPALASFGGLKIIERHWDDGYAYPENAFWGDAFVVLQRPARPNEEACAVFGPVASANALARRTAETMSTLSAWRVKLGLVREALFWAYIVCRTPLRRLKRP